MANLEKDLGEHVLKPSPDPWILRMIEQDLKQQPIPWASINDLAYHMPQAQTKQILIKGIESEMKNIRERLEISKMMYDISKKSLNSPEIGKPGPTPWKIIDAIAKPGPLPWKMIDTVASYMPKEEMKQILIQGLETEMRYMQEGLAIRKIVHDRLKEKELND